MHVMIIKVIFMLSPLRYLIMIFLLSISLPSWATNPTELVALQCINCHSTTQSKTPVIQGTPAKQMTLLLKSYKSGKLPGTVMNRITQGFNEAELTALAHYFSQLK